MKNFPSEAPVLQIVPFPSGASFVTSGSLSWLLRPSGEAFCQSQDLTWLSGEIEAFEEPFPQPVTLWLSGEREAGEVGEMCPSRSAFFDFPREGALPSLVSIILAAIIIPAVSSSPMASMDPTISTILVVFFPNLFLDLQESRYYLEDVGFLKMISVYLCYFVVSSWNHCNLLASLCHTYHQCKAEYQHIHLNHSTAC